MGNRLDLYEAEALYKKCKAFCETWEFGNECNDRKGMYVYLEGIEEDLASHRRDIIRELGINACPFKEIDNEL